MVEPQSEPIFPVGFDDDAVEENLTHLPDGAEEALRSFRKEMRRLGGIPKSRLMACQADGRDGTQLGGCVKTYIPWPNGRFGAVFVAVTHPARPLPCAWLPSAYAITRRARMPGLSTRLQIADFTFPRRDQAQMARGKICMAGPETIGRSGVMSPS